MPRFIKQARQDQRDKKLYALAEKHAFAYLDSLDHARVSPDKQAIEDLQLFKQPLAQEGDAGQKIIDQLGSIGSNGTVRSAGGRYFGLVTGSSFPVAQAAKWLASVWDQATPLYLSSPVTSVLEQTTEAWLKQIFRLPEQTVAGFVSGSSMAIFCALAAARLRLYKNLGWDINTKGLNGAPEIRIIASKQVHATVIKAVALLGLGTDNIEWLQVDQQGRIIVDKMPELNNACLLLLQAGDVTTGAFDDFRTILPRAKQAGAWVHIDGAFGLWARCATDYQYLCEGIELADSYSVDAHKTLNTPYDNGIVLCQDRAALIEALQANEDYILYDGGQRDGMMYTPEMSRRARVIELWATMKFLGVQGIDDLVTHLCAQAQRLTEKLQYAGFHVANEVVFNQVVVALEQTENVNKFTELVQSYGDCWVGVGRLHHQPVIRISVCSWATSEDDLDIAVTSFARARNALAGHQTE